MKKLFTIGLLLFALNGIAQTDSTRRQVADSVRRQIAYSAGVAAGAGFTFSEEHLPSYYGEFIGNRTGFPTGSFHVTVLFKEKIGFRITAGTTGARTEFSHYDAYNTSINPDFHAVPNYSEMYAGFSYDYITPQFVYRIGDEPFNFTMIGGAGPGRLSMPGGSIITQKDGSNQFFHIAYDSPVVTNMNADLQLEFAYMRQLSQHLFMNAGIYAGTFMIAANYKYSITYHENGTRPVYSEVNEAKHVMMTYNTGLFLHFQWNKRESERAYYE